MARLNTTKPKAGDDTRPNKKPVRHLGQRGVLQSKFRDTVSTSDSEDRDDTQWRSKIKASRTTEGQSQRTARHQRTGTVSSGIFDIFSDADGAGERDDDASRSSGANKASKDGALDLARVNSLLRRPSQQSRHRTSRKSELYNYDKENDPVEVELAEDDDSHTPSTISRNPSDASQRSPVRNARQTPARSGSNRLYSQYRQPQRRPEDEDSEDNGFGSLDEFIVSDNEEPSYHETSDNETEDERVQEIPSFKPKRKLMRGRRPNPEAELLKRLQHPSPKDDLRLEPSLPAAITLPPSPERKSEWKNESEPEQESEEPSQDDVNFSEKMHHLSLEDNDPSAQLQQELFGFVEDSASTSPTPEPEVISLETPPSSPSKTILPSPSKSKAAIPPTPYRESVDAFWSQELTNNWVDQHSPRKKVDRLLHEFAESDNETDPDMMPRRRGAIKQPKTPSKTALKKAETEQKKAALARRRSFDNKKANVAEDFFKALDDAVSGGRIQEMAADTGGVRITWSKTLQTTAGRASWRRERSMSPGRGGAGERTVGSQKQFAGIELAARIIDNEDRLINTLAHEYCHLANYMISNVTNNPHGTSFKLWGQKCKEALKDHPVYGGRIEVTTKHSYKIDWKYVWCCVDCGQSYGRHSKSIDPAKSTCGKCKGLLQQIKPKPRNVSPKKKPAPQAAAGGMDMGMGMGMGFPRAAVDNVTMVLQEVNVLHH
ncbi:hypothetical protein P170DRAFT_463487 [Aspergillus steynii IBT 23096]|uniref:SprT-like domain-containing protein n=1 Tax=Aspergillus steynii IBT 23096 TaxID=1392250 RepID=A0A2I2GBG6_9EURO|nr:uncharacterized protein P170DRAFT_463487 [Aspergillus steynii IBT 23096]PLB50229.1 hypothetical protein P170DRAFT_463487 [Aspergillus steynii IBT 23096]